MTEPVQTTSELIRPDIEGYELRRFTATVNGHTAEATFNPADRFIPTNLGPQVSWTSYSEKHIDIARAHIAAVTAAIEFADEYAATLEHHLRGR